MAKEADTQKAVKDKERAIEAAISQLEKTFGKGTVMKLGESAVTDGIRVIPTGSLTLDIATGVGGLPRGRVVEIFGPESSGKTTLALSAIAQAQKTGGVAAFIDAEHALDVSYASRLGVKISELLISQPDSGEQALEVAETLVRSNALDILVIDSVAALVPKAEIEGDMGDQLPGLQARLMSQALRKLTSAIARSSTTVVFINQIRLKIGVMFGSPETTSGGNALKFYASMRLDIRKIDNLKVNQEIIGGRVRVKVVKNKVAPPFRQAEFDIYYNEGISKAGEIVDLGVEMGVIERTGTWYSYGTTKIGQGRDNARRFLTENENIFKEAELRILEAGKISRAVPAVLNQDLDE
ncbi:recombinase RecA [Candidatus Magnetomonas plexicatena]|uniref:recombinase RecA n=1 Tax=Candidatus Magnetomonas plexicatena TaxID=2552947 RepID=UPI001C74B61A|nr:recombinase RecA [Nitrospirales bacterium LBB_01]